MSRKKPASVLTFVMPVVRSRAPHAPRKFSAGLFAFTVTAAIHAAIALVALVDWRSANPKIVSAEKIVVTLMPLPPDEPARKSRRGPAAKTAPVETSAAKPAARMIELRQSVVPERAAVAIEPPMLADAGRDEQLASITQSFQRSIVSRLEAVRDYPRTALLRGHHGSGSLVFRLDRQGSVIAVAIENSTGRPALDRAALALVRDAAPFPAIPGGLPDELAITMPIEFLIVVRGDLVTSR